MKEALLLLGIFTLKFIIVVALILLLLIGIVVILSQGKDKSKGKLVIKNLNQKFEQAKEDLLAETLTKKQFKQFLKKHKAEEKAKKNADEKQKNVYVLKFDGDIKASAVEGLREEINVILSVATPEDEVVVRLDSAGGVVHGYGLAAAQLARLRSKKIPLTVAVDKIAASGGYMMACIGDKILAAPFAIIGSIGVIMQLPNFHRLLKDKHIEFEQVTAGDYKRTLTMFGENTPEKREKMQHELEDIHGLFKNLIKQNRQQVDLEKVATGEHWLAQQAIELKLVDELKTSDEYIMDRAKNAAVYEVAYETKKSFLSKFGIGAASYLRKFF